MTDWKIKPAGRPPINSVEYLAWFWIQHLQHLRRYTEEPGAVTDPDLNEDLREIDYEAASDSLRRLIEERDSLQSQLNAIEGGRERENQGRIRACCE